jgi:hypothetical protein
MKHARRSSVVERNESLPVGRLNKKIFTTFSIATVSERCHCCLSGPPTFGSGVHGDRHVRLRSLPSRAASQDDFFQVESPFG